MLRYGVLGPTEVHEEDRPVDLGGRLPRRLLAALLVAEGRPVPDDRLADAVWTGQPPGNPSTALQVYVSRLRRALGDAGRDVLRRASGGYRLIIEPGSTDADRFIERLAAARALVDGGRPGGAVREFDTGLALWRGEPYADLDRTPAVSAARAYLKELRDSAVEERLTARLATGDAPGAVAELDAAVRAAPYRERRWALLIVGLYRCGRQNEALTALRRARTLLADELGVDPGPELQQLERRVLAQDPHLLLPEPAPTRPLSTGRPTWLAPPLSSFLGRDDDLALLTRLAQRQRLVTVVGPAGAGKTRLAIEYAATRTDSDGPWLVRLADVADPTVLPSAVAAAVGVVEGTGPPLDALVDALRGRGGLLLLDNCEHLVEPVTRMVLDLLHGCPGLHVLATSREPLGVDGERTLPLGPLSTDAAVALLVDRIQAIRPAWTPDVGELADIRHLAIALDGIPLALELAAARARVLGLRELVDNLHDRFAVLDAVPRGSLTPHATLHGAIAWSVDLLSPADRALLLRLWPFEGGFSLEAAVAMRPSGPGPAPLQSLSSLVSRSVVTADTTVTPTRYRLLETVRAYCRAQDPAAHAPQAAHAAWVRALVARSAVELRGERSAHAIRVLARELPNLRAAIAYDLATAPSHALRTVGQLDWFWIRGGRLVEGRRLLSAALEAASHAPPTDVARAWSAYAALNYLGGDANGTADALARAIRTLGDPRDRDGRVLLGQVRYYQALMQGPTGDPETARRAAVQAMDIGREVGQGWIVACGEMTLGAALVRQGHEAEGRAALHSAIHRALGCGQTWTAAMSELLLGQFMLAAGDPAQDVLAVLRNALRRFHQEDDLSNTLAVLHTGTLALTTAGRHDRAIQLRTAVHQHAMRRGLRLETYAAHAPDINGRPGPLPEDQAGEPPDWDATIALLTEDD